MALYEIPRNLKGESKILIVFSMKALIYTVVGIILGAFINLFIGLIFNLTFWTKIIAIAIFGGIGFVIGTFKIPENSSMDISKKAGGENIDETIIKYIKFKRKKNRIYLYTKEETK